MFTISLYILTSPLLLQKLVSKGNKKGNVKAELCVKTTVSCSQQWKEVLIISTSLCFKHKNRVEMNENRWKGREMQKKECFCNFIWQWEMCKVHLFNASLSLTENKEEASKVEWRKFSGKLFKRLPRPSTVFLHIQNYLKNRKLSKPSFSELLCHYNFCFLDSSWTYFLIHEGNYLLTCEYRLLYTTRAEWNYLPIHLLLHHNNSVEM